MKRFTSMMVAVFAVATLALCALPASQAHAASSAALSIVPKKNYTVTPGKTVRDTLVIRNLDTEQPLVLSMRIVDFTFTDDGGTPKLLLAEDIPQTTWSLKPFLNIPKSVTIPPKESKTLNMNVAVPAGQGAGSYYSAIVYSSGASEGGNVGLSASGVTLVFTSIPGKVNEDLQLEKLGAYVRNDYRFITAEEPQQIAFTIKNNGNVTEAPAGSITLRDVFGRERVINEVNPNSSLALIGQSRTFVSCIKLKTEDIDFNGTRTSAPRCESPSLWPGYYSVKTELYYGQNGNRTQELVGNASFWYLPWWFVAICLILFAVAAYYGRKAYLKAQAMMNGGRPKKKTSRRRR